MTKAIIATLVVAVALSFNIGITAADVQLPPVKPSIDTLITRDSGLYGVSREQVYKTLMCESKLNPNAVGDHGQSFGIAQIHLPSHKDITKKQALDPEFSILWTVKNFSKGKQSMWTCARLLGYG